MRKIISAISAVLIFQAVSFSQWSVISSLPGASVNNIIISGNTLYSGTYNGVFRSTDGTTSWQPVNSGLNNTQALTVYQLLLTGGVLYAATVDGIYRSSNLGANWIKKSDGIAVGGGALYAFSESIYENAGVLYTGTYTGIYRSTNGGDNWVVTNISGTDIEAKNFLNYNGIIFAARESINIPGSYKSTDNGVTWAPFSINSTYLPAITFFNDGARLYAGTIDGVWLSTNNGLNWASRNQGLSLDPYSSSIIRANGVLVTSLKFGGSGIFSSTNDGALWNDFGAGLPFLSEISQLLVFNNNILAATSGGIFKRNLNDLNGITTVSSEIPASFSLSQNYPNPFNPSTKIKFDVPNVVNGRDLSLRLIIYDAIGREAATLVNEDLKPGSYEVSWDAGNFPSGVYFYTLRSENYSKTAKMLLIK